MGDVILKSSFVRNPKFDKLSWFEESLALRMMAIADDDGLVDARPMVIRNTAFPTKTTVTVKVVESAMSKLVVSGILIPNEEQENGIPSFRISEELFEVKPKIVVVINNNNNKDLYNNNNNNEDCSIYSDSLGLRHNEYENQGNYQVEHNEEPKNIPVTFGNPFSEQTVEGTTGAEAKAVCDSVQSYVTRNLSYMSPGQLQVLQALIDDLPEELIRLAVDKCCDGGFSKRNFRYFKAILDNWEECGYRTVADVEAAEEARKARKKQQKARKSGAVYTEMGPDDW